MKIKYIIILVFSVILIIVSWFIFGNDSSDKVSISDGPEIPTNSEMDSGSSYGPMTPSQADLPESKSKVLKYPLSIEQEISIAKETNNNTTLFVFLNQYGNPLNLHHGESGCGEPYTLCGVEIFDAIGEKISIDVDPVYVTQKKELQSKVSPVSAAYWDDDMYIYQTAEELPEGTYTLRTTLSDEGKIGPKLFRTSFVFRGDGLGPQYEQRTTVARYYSTPIEHTFTIQSTSNDSVIKVIGKQKYVAYQSWAICGDFKNVLGTELKFQNVKAKLMSEEGAENVHNNSYWMSQTQMNGACISSADERNILMPGKYELHVTYDGYKPAIIPVEFPDVASLSDDEVREQIPRILELVRLS